MYIVLKTVALPFLIAIAFIVAMIVAANAQDVYRPIAMKKEGWGGLGLFCITGPQIDLVSKFFGFTWVRDLNTMTLLNGEEKIEIEFTGDCATSAKVVK
jgi:hypothetical protein